MKIKLLMATAVTAALALSSCSSEESKLAGAIAGTWNGTATQMSHRQDKPDRKDRHDGDRNRMDAGEMSCTPTLTFVRTDGTNGGTIDISANYTLTRGVESVASATPVSATVNGSIKASGTWTAHDDDEVIINLDPTKTVVDVDTTSVSLNYAQLTDAPKDSLASMRSRVISNIPDVVKPMLEARVMKMRKLDDIKITGNLMTLEAGHTLISFTKR